MNWRTDNPVGGDGVHCECPNNPRHKTVYISGNVRRCWDCKAVALVPSALSTQALAAQWARAERAENFLGQCRVAGDASELAELRAERDALRAQLAEAQADRERLVLAGAAMIVWLDDWQKRMAANYAEKREYDFPGALLADGERFKMVVDELRQAIDAARAKS